MTMNTESSTTGLIYFDDSSDEELVFDSLESDWASFKEESLADVLAKVTDNNLDDNRINPQTQKLQDLKEHVKDEPITDMLSAQAIVKKILTELSVKEKSEVKSTAQGLNELSKAQGLENCQSKSTEETELYYNNVNLPLLKKNLEGTLDILEKLDWTIVDCLKELLGQDEVEGDSFLQENNDNKQDVLLLAEIIYALVKEISDEKTPHFLELSKPSIDKTFLNRNSSCSLNLLKAQILELKNYVIFLINMKNMPLDLGDNKFHEQNIKLSFLAHYMGVKGLYDCQVDKCYVNLKRKYLSDAQQSDDFYSQVITNRVLEDSLLYLFSLSDKESDLVSFTSALKKLSHQDVLRSILADMNEEIHNPTFFTGLQDLLSNGDTGIDYATVLNLSKEDLLDQLKSYEKKTAHGLYWLSIDYKDFLEKEKDFTCLKEYSFSEVDNLIQGTMKVALKLSEKIKDRKCSKRKVKNLKDLSIKYLISAFLIKFREQFYSSPLLKRKVLPVDFKFQFSDFTSFIANMRLLNRSLNRRSRNLLQHTTNVRMIEQVNNANVPIFTCTRVWEYKKKKSSVGSVELMAFDTQMLMCKRSEKRTDLLSRKHLMPVMGSYLKICKELLKQELPLNGKALANYIEGFRDKMRNDYESFEKKELDKNNFLYKLFYLLFGIETLRNPSLMVLNNMLLDILGETDLTISQVFYGSGSIKKINFISGLMPTAPKEVTARSRDLNNTYRRRMPKKYFYPGVFSRSSRPAVSLRYLLIREARVMKIWFKLFSEDLKIEEMTQEEIRNEIFNHNKFKGWFYPKQKDGNEDGGESQSHEKSAAKGSKNYCDIIAEIFNF